LLLLVSTSLEEAISLDPARRMGFLLSTKHFVAAKSLCIIITMLGEAPLCNTRPHGIHVIDYGLLSILRRRPTAPLHAHSGVVRTGAGAEQAKA